MPDVSSFDDIRDEFERRVRKTVWATVATVDRAGNPRTRLMHPVWDGSTGYIGTLPGTLLARHVAMHPRVSLSYGDVSEPVYVDAVAHFVDDPDERRRAWDYIKSLPEPYGFDPAAIHPLWADGPGAPGWAVLKLTPVRIDIFIPPAKVNSRVWRTTASR